MSTCYTFEHTNELEYAHESINLSLISHLYANGNHIAITQHTRIMLFAIYLRVHISMKLQIDIWLSLKVLLLSSIRRCYDYIIFYMNTLTIICISYASIQSISKYT